MQRPGYAPISRKKKRKEGFFNCCDDTEIQVQALKFIVYEYELSRQIPKTLLERSVCR
jgi:hypothetical protein